jgi:hypothetical protein
MTNSAQMPRKLLILAVVLPLAAVIGYKLATPDSITTVGLVGLVVFTCCIPLFIRWHHPLLVLSWNAAVSVFFLPGKPQLWIVFSGISFFFAVMDRLLTKQSTFQRVPSLIWPLMLLVLVTVVTAKVRGGIGLHAFGGESYGGRRYLLILAAMIGFFGLIGRRIPAERADLYAGLFMLSGMTWMVSNLIYPFPALYFLYAFFPANAAMDQAMSDMSRGAIMARYTGFGFGSAFLFYYLLARWGIRGVLDVSKPWRLLLSLMAGFVGLLGGFRSVLVLCFLAFTFQFFFERIHRTKLALAFLIVAILGGAGLVAFSAKLPLPVQRSLSLIPGLQLDPVAKYNAEVTVEWRLQMWKLLLPEVPRYFWIGKGYTMDPTEFYLMYEAVKRGLAQDVEASMLSGSYHSGPLTLILHLGVFGAAAFIWFCTAALRALYRNYKYGDPRLHRINTFLLAYFATRLIYFLVFYGHFAEDLFFFTGIVGLSVSLNGGIAPAPQLQPATSTERELVPVPA